ncbi:MAG: ATP-binding cassette domain-containing protein, partial [Actinobacteria bacterium]|nr:ATP-binding cassette domain-containing protein [Actinomycetota bacterium]
MILVSKVSKKFKNKIAVDNITFKAKEGEIVGFVGPNGAGKTTTMRLLLGYLSPSEGKIFIDDINPIENRIEILKKIGYLPENNPLYTEMTVSEYLQFVGETKGVAEYEGVGKEVGLETVIKSKIEELSRGYKQRVGLAAALLGNPEILILDEPTSGLDPLEQEKIRDLIRKLAKKKTIIFSTHILSEVEDVANRLVIIDRGK